jgi:hypothetical protein
MAPTGPAQRAYRDWAPIAISTLPSGVLPVLEFRGGLSLINPVTGMVTPSKETLGNFTPLDMAAVRLGNEEFIFVTMYWAFSTQSTQGNEGLVVQYSLQGQEVHKWFAARFFPSLQQDRLRGWQIVPWPSPQCSIR